MERSHVFGELILGRFPGFGVHGDTVTVSGVPENRNVHTNNTILRTDVTGKRVRGGRMGGGGNIDAGTPGQR